MRYYKLTIGTFGEISFELGSKNMNAPAIEFSIQQFQQLRTTNSEITLYNLPTYMYGQFPKLIGQKIQLFAGFERSPVTTANGMTISKGLIFQGYISQIIPDYGNIDKGLMFIVQSVPFYTEIAGQPVARNFLTSFFNLNIKIGDDPVTLIKVAFLKLTGLGTVLDTSTVISKPAQVATSQTIYNIYDLATLAETCYGLVIYEAVDKFIMKNKEALSMPTQPIILQASDFITQPSSISTNTIALTLNMRAGITINSFIILPPQLFVGLIGLSEVRNIIGFNLFLNKSVYLFFSGALNVFKVWHVGNSRSPDAQSWATHIEAVNVAGLN